MQKRFESDDLRAAARDLRSDAAKCSRRFEIRRGMDLMHAAAKLETEADIRDSMVREHEFERTVVGYLKLYDRQQAEGKRPRAEGGGPAPPARSTATILNEFKMQVERRSGNVAMAVRDVCPRCGLTLLLNASRSTMACSECGYAMTYLDSTSSCTSFEEVVEFSQYSYKRVNHYTMWLALIQGKESHRVPMDIIESVMCDLYDRQKIRTKDEVNVKAVREALRKHRLRKGYDHVAQITARISGRQPPRISEAVEEQLRTMFLQMQPAFQKHSPKLRTNFLSYSYILYRCFQILNLPHMLENITLLKGRDKLEANDAIFRKMCEELNLPIFDLPPPEMTV